MMTAREALEQLREGNRRFVSKGHGLRAKANTVRPGDLVGGQNPHAIILGCSDSRVPAELIFDQGLGDLFVIRVAGNVVASTQIGSVEFAASAFGTRLVVVLGHSTCGAVLATLEELEQPGRIASPNLQSLVDHIRPSVVPLLASDPRPARDALVARAVRANIHASVDRLRHGSALLEELIRDQGLLVVGAEYALDTGVVEFFEQPD